MSAVQASTSASSASDVGSVGAYSAPGSVIASLAKDPTIHEAMIFEDDADARWILAIEPSFRNATLEHLHETSFDAFHEVLLDSGAERCVCPPFWAREAPRQAQLNPCLVTASGEPLDHYGCRRVNLGFAGSPACLKVAFTILNVRRPILFVGSLLKHEHGVIFDRANPCLLLRDDSTKSMHCVPMEARGNTFVVCGRSVSSLLAPVMMEGAAAAAVPGCPQADSRPWTSSRWSWPRRSKRGLLRTRSVQTRKPLSVTTSRISRQLDGATSAHDLVAEMPLIEKPQPPGSMRYAL